MRNYLTHLECTYCGATYSVTELHRTCIACGKVLYARYDLDSAKSAFPPESLEHGRPATMWRYIELMPVQQEEHIVTLGEGFTPILKTDRLAIDLGLTSLYVKDEGQNPTASFKARGLSAAVSRAYELGATRLTLPSAGNAAGALAAYCARAGLEANIFMPQDAPSANKIEVGVTGAAMTLVDGLIGDAGQLSQRKAEQQGLFDISTLKEPYRVEGKKTLGYEIAEQMGWQLPDVILYPTGGGTGLVGMWKAFQEMEELGWIDSKLPRMYCVQAAGCAPIVRAFQQDQEFADPWLGAQTIAAGIRVPSAIGDYLILRALRESGGGAVTVTDDEILTAMRQVATQEGLFICPEGAATVPALRKLIAAGEISPDERILILNTGSGLKYLDLLTQPSRLLKKGHR